MLFSPEGVELGWFQYFTHLCPMPKSPLLSSFRLARNSELYLKFKSIFLVLKLFMFHMYTFLFQGHTSTVVGLGVEWLKNTNMVCISSRLMSLRLWISACSLRLNLWSAKCFTWLWFQFFHFQSKKTFLYINCKLTVRINERKLC